MKVTTITLAMVLALSSSLAIASGAHATVATHERSIFPPHVELSDTRRSDAR